MIEAVEYAARRTRFLASLGTACAVLFGATTVYRNADAEYEFRQNSDFLYLTGFTEPNAVAVFKPGPAPNFVLFVMPRDPAAETWTGYRYGVEGAIAEFGADAAFPIEELDARLPDYFLGAAELAYDIGIDEARDRRVLGAVRTARERARRGGTAPLHFQSAAAEIHEMRLFKSAAEIDLMRQAAAITAAGFAAGLAATRPDLDEFVLEAIIEAHYFQGGAQAVAYPSIVAGGANAVILHYNTNRARLAADTLVLIDSGCELHGYASDVTRTWPVSGKFSGARRALYEIVLAANEAAIAECRAGLAFSAYHDSAVRVLTQGLIDLNIIRESLETALETRAYAPYYMHRTGHWLGLDVHDCGSYTKDGAYRTLEPGMVLTVEPGLYIAPDAAVPPEFQGIGIRIEDDICITTGLPENLTAAIPKALAALESRAA